MIPFIDFNPLDLGVICGGVRNFKTLELVRLMKIADIEGYKVYSNVNLKGFTNFVHLDSTDPGLFIQQIKDIIHKRFNERNFAPAFLGIDEFSGIADSVNWKSNNKDSNIWKQLGKVGFTTYCTNQAFSMTYNRYRDNANIKKITKRINEFYYVVNVYQQSNDDHEEYNLLIDSYPIYAFPYFEMYDTHQVLYL